MAKTRINQRSGRVRGQSIAIILGIVLLLGLAAVTGWPWLRAYAQSGAILMQLNGEPLPALLKPLAGKKLAIQDVTIPSPAGPIPARLYTPVGIQHPPGLMLVHGMNYQGMDERSLKRYAKLEASCGLLVLTPDVSALRQYRIDTASVDTIGESAKWFAARTGNPVALMGFSFSGGLTLMAAARPEYAPSVKLVFELGGYDDLVRLTRYYVTGADPRPDGTVDRETPSKFGLLVVDYIQHSVFLSSADRAALFPVLLDTLYNRQGMLAIQQARLTPAQVAEWNSILSAHTNEAGLDAAESRNEAIVALSPHGHLTGLSAPVFLLHGTDDDYIPSAEVEWIARDLPPGRLQEMLISPILVHVRLNGKSIVWRDKWRLVHFMATELRAVETQ